MGYAGAEMDRMTTSHQTSVISIARFAA